MSSKNPRPTVDEIYELLKRTSIPTVLVEGKDDIIFYRAVEEELHDLEVDMLPAGNKDAVLELRRKLKETPISAPIAFVVDNDIWVYPTANRPDDIDDLITTAGYSIENDLFLDGELENLLDRKEMEEFKTELKKFSRWYALSVNRNIEGIPSSFRLNVGKVLDDDSFYSMETTLSEGETYPESLYASILENYGALLRGKSLFALIHRRLSARNRSAKFGTRQLMAIGASRKGVHFQRIHTSVRKSLEKISNTPAPS